MNLNCLHILVKCFSVSSSRFGHRATGENSINKPTTEAKDVLKCAVWKSKKQLVSQLMDYVKTYNEQRAKPFKWTYTGKPLTI